MPAGLQSAVDAAIGAQASEKTAQQLGAALEDARGELGIDAALPDYAG